MLIENIVSPAFIVLLFV